MTARDLPTVLKLENEIFPDPWPRSAFDDVVDGKGWGGIIAEADQVVIGYACYLFVDVEARLTNIAVVKSFRRMSVARRMLEEIVSRSQDNDSEFILLEVRPSNEEAIAFYEEYKFRLLYRRPNYYRRPVEDALVMVRYLE